MPDAGRRRDQDSRLLEFGIRIGINAAALWLASEWVRGFDIDGWRSVLVTAAIFALVNTVIKPAATFLGWPITCLTLGFFILVINTLLLWLTVAVAAALDANVEIDGVLGVFTAALLVSIVSWVLNVFVGAPVRRVFK